MHSVHEGNRFSTFVWNFCRKYTTYIFRRKEEGEWLLNSILKLHVYVLSLLQMLNFVLPNNEKNKNLNFPFFFFSFWRSWFYNSEYFFLVCWNFFLCRLCLCLCLSIWKLKILYAFIFLLKTGRGTTFVLKYHHHHQTLLYKFKFFIFFFFI